MKSDLDKKLEAHKIKKKVADLKEKGYKPLPNYLPANFYKKSLLDLRALLICNHSSSFLLRIINLIMNMIDKI